MDWQIPLLVSASAFGAYLVFKMRPQMGSVGRASASLLREARARIEAAKDEPARANALCDAADACARLGRANGAIGYYLRALRADPSKVIVERAAASLARRPAALEKLMWRHLAAEPWTGEHREAALAALRALAAVYGRRPNQPRARAMENAVQALSAK